MEQTLVMIKPDGVKRHLIGTIMQRFEQKGLTLVGAKLVLMSNEKAMIHYIDHREKPFYQDLVSFITSGSVFMMVWQGEDVVKIARLMIGEVDPLRMIPGTIRGDFTSHLSLNVIHGSDSLHNAEREIALHFDASELIE